MDAKDTWTQRLDAEVGQQRDTAVGRRGWTHRLDAGRRGWTQRVGVVGQRLDT